MTAKLHIVQDSNNHDHTQLLRDLADEMERGDYGTIRTIGVVLWGDELQVFAGGPDSRVQSVALILHAGFMMASKEFIGDFETLTVGE